MEVTQLGEQASGMLTERATILQAEDLVASGTVDLVVAEDLARIYRNPRHQYNFVQDCVDIGTRVICIGDNLDTADENWEITMGAATLRHGLHIPDTRRRVRRTATHCFHKGGMVQKFRYGYRKLTREEAASGEHGPKDLRIIKRSECTPIIREMMNRILRGNRFAAVADWLNAEGIAPGPYVVSRRWSARLVVGLLDDPILSGTRTFRDSIYRPIFKTGKHKPVKNSKPEIAFYPELAHLSAEEHKTLRREIARRRAEVRAKDAKPQRQGMPRSRSIWPGRACRCGICGGLMYYIGAQLRCKNALPCNGQTCWNHVLVSAEFTRQRVVAWLVEHVESVPELRQAMLEIVWRQLERTSGGHMPRRDLAREIASLERQAANLAVAIAEGGQMQALVQKLRAVEETLETTRAAQRSEASGGTSVSVLIVGRNFDISAACGGGLPIFQNGG
jgi:DNA invertase Pin-like site-specific DNA recombinase